MNMQNSCRMTGEQMWLEMKITNQAEFVNILHIQQGRSYIWLNPVHQNLQDPSTLERKAQRHLSLESRLWREDLLRQAQMPDLLKQH